MPGDTAMPEGHGSTVNLHEPQEEQEASSEPKEYYVESRFRIEVHQR
ncbi:MAG: hypothetical protein K8U57_04520 [Planctomycetes bacterium]|nr:hypothetical protein [Planctomycetota bacterium]